MIWRKSSIIFSFLTHWKTGIPLEALCTYLLVISLSDIEQFTLEGEHPVLVTTHYTPA